MTKNIISSVISNIFTPLSAAYRDISEAPTKQKILLGFAAGAIAYVGSYHLLRRIKPKPYLKDIDVLLDPTQEPLPLYFNWELNHATNDRLSRHERLELGHTAATANFNQETQQLVEVIALSRIQY